MEELLKNPGDRLYEVFHVTRYDYAEPVSLSLQEIRLTPRFRRFEQELISEPSGNLRFARDAFENPTYCLEHIGKTKVLSVTNRMKVIRSSANPFDFLLSPEALERPIRYSEKEKQALLPFFDPQARENKTLEDAAQNFFPREKETISFLTGLNGALNSGLNYEPRDEPGIFETSELLERGAGSCRDFAAFLQKLLQFEGLASRFVSGYLLETGDLQGAEAMHAWTEVYVPGAGWMGLDPTNGILIDEAFVPCAVAAFPGDTTPLGGKFFSDHPVEAEMSTELQIKCIDSR